MADSSLRVLVVDDVSDAADSIAAVLRLEGFEVRTAYSGADALRVAEEFKPDAVILDINMPGITGYDLARELRSHKRAPAPALIALSGMGEESDRIASKRVRIDHHLVKPVDLARLVSLLRSVASGKPGSTPGGTPGA